MLLPTREQGGVEAQTLKVIEAFRAHFARVVVALPETSAAAMVRARLEALEVPTVTEAIEWDDASKAAANHARQVAAVERLSAPAPFALALVAVPWPRVGLGLLAGLAKADIPSVAVFHLASENAWVPPVERAAALAGRPTLVAVSPALRDTLASRLAVPRKAIHVIPNGVEKVSHPTRDQRSLVRRDIRRPLGVPADVPLVLTVARFSRLKGYEDLVTVAEIVTRRRPDAHFLCLGDGPLRPTIVRMLEARGLCGTRVHCPGWVPDPGPHYEAADLFLLPTRGEGHSLALLEAAAHRLPIVTTTASGQERLLAAGREALLAPPGDVPALAKAVLDVLADPVLAQRLRSAAAAWAERHNLEVMKASYVRLAERVVSWQ